MPAVVYQFSAVGFESVEKAYQSVIKASAKSEKARVASASKIEKAEIKAAEKAARAAEKASRAAEKAENDRWRNYDRSARKVIAATKREADARIREDERATKKAQENRLKLLKSVAGNVSKKVETVGLAGAGVAAGVVGAAARGALRLQEISNRLSISSRGAGENAVDPATLRKEFEATAIKTPGVKSEDIAEATAGFVGKTGRLDIAREMQGTFAEVASATGASVQDISEAAADLFQKFDIKTIDEMKTAFAALNSQAKLGSFELRDAAAQYAKLSAAASKFGVSKGAEGVRILGGLTQIARTSTGSAEQASTSVESMFSHLVQNSTKLKGQGVKVFNAKGETRDIRDVLTDTIAKVGGNNMEQKQAGLQKVFGEQGIRAVSPLISAYTQTFNSTKGTDKEREAAARAKVTQILSEQINASADYTEIQKDAAQAQQDATAQLTGSWEKLKAAVATEAIPAIQKLMPQFTEIATQSIPALVGGFSALLEMVTALSEFLKALGIIKEKEPEPKTHKEKAADAQKALEEFDKNRSIGPLTPEEQAKRDKLEETVKNETTLDKRAGDVEAQVKKEREERAKILAKNRAKAVAAGALVGGVKGGIGAGLAFDAAHKFDPLEEETRKAEDESIRRAEQIRTPDELIQDDADIRKREDAALAASVAAEKAAKSRAEADDKAAKASEKLATNLERASTAAKNLPINQR